MTFGKISIVAGILILVFPVSHAAGDPVEQGEESSGAAFPASTDANSVKSEQMAPVGSQSEAEMQTEYVEDESTVALRNWAADSQVILALANEVRRHRIGMNDTSVQRDAKKRAAVAALAALNRRIKGQAISLRQLRVSDVTEQKELTAVGRQRARSIVQQLRQQPASAGLVGNGDLDENPFLALAVYMNLAFCTPCFRPTGRFIVNLDMPIVQYGNLQDSFSSAALVGNDPSSGDVQTVQTKIEYIVDRQHAQAFDRNSIIALQARILSLYYDPSVDSIKLTLH